MLDKQTNRHGSLGFTLLELLLAMMILAGITTLTFVSFHAVNQAWKTGRSVINATSHADYIMDQLSSALRSAYTPGMGDKHGFEFEDDGDGASARDQISWSKIGHALIGDDTDFAGVPHRVEVSITDPDQSHHVVGGFTIKSWRQDLQTDEFNPEDNVQAIYLSPEVMGLNCRMLDPTSAKTEGEPNWLDAWEKTDIIPSAVEVTLYLKPPEGNDEPIEIQRIIEIPIATLSQNPDLKSKDKASSHSKRPGGGNRPGWGGTGGGLRP